MVFVNYFRNSKHNLFFLLAMEFLCNGGNAQVKFFINPHINFKSAFAFVDPASLNNTEKNYFENQYFYTPYAVSESRRFIKHPCFNYGISIGGYYKNNSRMLQLSFDNDGVFFSTKSFFRPANSEIHHGYEISYQGVKIYRLTIGYSQKITKKDSFLQSWFTLGIGSFMNFNRFTGTFPAYWDLQVAYNARLIKTYMQPFEENKVNGFIKLGFENDLYYKQKYLFSLKACYIQGFGVVSRVEYVHEYIIDNAQVFSRTGLMSRGTGFYFEISRRFNVFQLNKKNK
jgi:hypothetical protein